MVDSDLLERTVEAVRKSVDEFTDRFPNEPLAGYALITDDGLETLLCMAVSNTVIETSDDPDLLFSPHNWPYKPNASFKAMSTLLRNLQESRDFDEHVDAAFSTLVEALVQVRNEGLFPLSTFLSVGSSDPSEHLEALQLAAIRRLNDQPLVDAHARFFAKWARS